MQLRIAVVLAALASAACSAQPGAPSSSSPASDGGGASGDGEGGTGAGGDAVGDSAPASGGSDAGAPTPSPPADTLAAARALCVATINQYRATLSLAPYAPWDDVDTCVDGEAQRDSIAGTPHSAFGACAEHAQNECPDWPMAPAKLIPKCLQDMWNEGPGDDFEAHGHYINMSSTKYTKASCGFFQTADGHWWATQDFR